MYSYLVFATLDPRNFFQNVQELVNVKQAYEKYAVNYDPGTFVFSQLIKKYAGSVSEHYSQTGSLELSENLKLCDKAISELSKLENPTLEDELRVMSKVYNKTREEVLKDYSNAHNIPKFSSIKCPLRFNDVLAEIPMNGKNLPEDLN